MPAKLCWTRQADQDLTDTYLTIGKDQPDPAKRVYTSIQDRVTMIPIARA